VGDILLRDIQGAVIDGEFPTTILLGNSFLNRVEMVRDGTVMELRKK
jgi:aspartyl protease family protein